MQFTFSVLLFLVINNRLQMTIYAMRPIELRVIVFHLLLKMFKKSQLPPSQKSLPPKLMWFIAICASLISSNPMAIFSITWNIKPIKSL